MYTVINNKYRPYISKWMLLMFILVSIMILVGGLTRLTDSGLSITEWEFFKGFFPPMNDATWFNYFNEYKKIPEYKLQNSNMSMSEFKIIFWWEWAHRFFGRVIGLLFLLPLIFFSIKIGFKKLLNFHLIFILICFQGFLGWYMVKSGLVNRVDVSHYRLSIHLFFAFIILSLIFWNYLSLNNFYVKKQIIKNYLPEVFLILVFIQIVVGAFVSGMDAGKIYNSWPLMGNTYFPDDSKFINLFDLSVFNDPSLVQFIHRNLAYLILGIYFLLLNLVRRNKIDKLFKSINVLGIIIFFQVILGILTVLYGADIYIASLHQFGSIFLITSTLFFIFKNRYN